METVEIPYDVLLDEYNRLRTKCNKQLDYINSLKMAGSNGVAGMNNFFNLYSLYYSTISSIIRDNAFLELKKRTYNSIKYKLVDYNVFNEYTERFSAGKNKKWLYDAYAAFKLIIPHENGGITFPYTYDKKFIRVVKVDKAIVDLVRECIVSA